MSWIDWFEMFFLRLLLIVVAIDFIFAWLRRRREAKKAAALPLWQKAMQRESDFVIICSNGNAIVAQKGKMADCNCPECRKKHQAAAIERLMKR